MKGMNGALANEKLRTVILNVQIPGRAQPYVKEADYDQSNVTAGQYLEFAIEDDAIKSGPGYFVQFLGVYEDETTGAMKFYYGDSAATLVPGPNSISISPSDIGSSTKTAQINGRYLTANSPDAGPTGTLITRFQPPGGKPKMNVDKSLMLNGWFEAFALDTAISGFEVAVVEGGNETILFSDLKVGSSALVRGDAALVKVTKPLSYVSEGRGNVRVNAPADVYLGYFGSNPTLYSTKKVCYPTGSFGVPMLYSDAAMTQIMEYTGSTPVISKVSRASGGVSQPMGDLYAGSATGGCASGDRDLGNAMWFYYNKSVHGDREFGGFSPPFVNQRPFEMHGGYLESVYNPGGPSINLKWTYMPGAATALGSGGVQVWAKYDPSHASDGGDHDKEPCGKYLKDKGFTAVADVAAPTETYDFTAVGGTALTSMNRHDFVIRACAYRGPADDTREYVGRYISADCTGGVCGAIEHFGWGIASHTMSGNVYFDDPTIGGKYSRVTNKTLNTGSTLVSLADATGFNPGDEVLFHVVGQSANSACGSLNGDPITAGQVVFTRVIQKPNSTDIRIPSGLFLDVPATGELNGAENSANFCYIQAVRVPHFKDLTVGSFRIIAQPLGYTGGSYAGGGIIALRASGTLSISASGSLDAFDKGYPGGSLGYHGGGDRSSPSATPNTHIGGQKATTYAGGGGGFGNGGDGNTGSVAPGGIGQNSNFMGLRFMFGGGGAAAGSPSGGNGGGIIFAMAKTVNSSGGSLNAAGAAASSDGGGGGGGSAMLFTTSLQGTSLAMTAYGGSGGSTSAGTGGGGGGYQGITACAKDAGTAVTYQNYGGTPQGTGIPGVTGNPSGLQSTANWWMCP